MATDTKVFQITQAPHIRNKEHVILTSKKELERLCKQYDLPLLELTNAVTTFGERTISPSYNLFFTYMGGIYYAVYEKLHPNNDGTVEVVT